MTKWCNTCEHKAYCRGGNDIYTMGCSRYFKAEPMTNEEWLHTLNTEQLAKVLKEMTDKCATCDTNQYDQRGECPFERCRIGLNEFVEWLKEKHK